MLPCQQQFHPGPIWSPFLSALIQVNILQNIVRPMCRSIGPGTKVPLAEVDTDSVDQRVYSALDAVEACIIPSMSQYIHRSSSSQIAGLKGRCGLAFFLPQIFLRIFHPCTARRQCVVYPPKRPKTSRRQSSWTQQTGHTWSPLKGRGGGCPLLGRRGGPSWSSAARDQNFFLLLPPSSSLSRSGVLMIGSISRNTPPLCFHVPCGASPNMDVWPSDTPIGIIIVVGSLPSLNTTQCDSIKKSVKTKNQDQKAR